jgi:hypothetical protein
MSLDEEDIRTFRFSEKVKLFWKTYKKLTEFVGGLRRESPEAKSRLRANACHLLI